MDTTIKTAARILTVVCLALVPLGAQQPAAPQAQPPKQVPGYVIGPNDVLRVTVYSGGLSQIDFRLNDYTVQTDGSIALPLLKPIVIAGLSVAAANLKIMKALTDTQQFGECTVDITVMGYHSSHLKVQGAVYKPGSVDMSAERMNISDVLNAAGNLTPLAGAEIRVKRAGNRPAAPGVLVRDGWEIYTRQALDNGTLVDVQLYDGDTIDVPTGGKFYVMGFVTTAGEHQWEPNLTLERALLMVGGVTKDGARNRIEIRRMDPKTKQSKKIKLADDPMSTLIEAGDIITVPKRWM